MTESFRYLTLASSLSSEACYSFIPESPTSGDWIEELCQAVRQARFSTSRYFKLLLLLTHIRNNISLQKYGNVEKMDIHFCTFKYNITSLK